jgi:uncharacterized protein
LISWPSSDIFEQLCRFYEWVRTQNLASLLGAHPSQQPYRSHFVQEVNPITMSTQISTSNRIEAIDVLRGFSLFGIVLIHMMEQYYAGPPPAGVDQGGILNGIASGFGGLFIMGKFFMIFSFLFGLSFHIQFSKSNSDGNFLLRFTWRLLMLLAIGMLHHIHYRGDILGIYALLGFALLLFYRLPDRALLILSLLLIFNIPALITRAVQIFLPQGPNIFDQDPKQLMAYYQTVKSGSYLEILGANLDNFVTKMEFQVFSGRIYITFGLFLLGIYAGRKRFFENLAANSPWLKKSIRISLWSILGAVVFSALFFGGAQVLKIELNQMVMWMVGGFMMDIFNAALAMIYVAWVLILFQKEKWNKRLMVLYPVGRMGLTVYLMQTFFGTMIFFSYGLGLVYELGSFYSLVLGLLMFTLQIFLARMWFRYFAYGPVEWVWRNLTYLRIQPMLLPKQKISQPV